MFAVEELIFTPNVNRSFAKHVHGTVIVTAFLSEPVVSIATSASPKIPET